MNNKNITIIIHNNNEYKKLKNDIENTLHTLYHLEDLTSYEIKEISACIDLLQNIEIKIRGLL